ncbi:MAG TPA: hypothetical protein VN257_04400 [Actinotalea sp.]|nr:hypothetical protein [Actinotalea sp.]
MTAPDRRRAPFTRALPLEGWSGRSRWGYDAVYECYWVELWPLGAAPEGDAAGDAAGGASDEAGPVRIGPERLIASIGTLAGVLARSAEVGPDEAYLALTA